MEEQKNNTKIYGNEWIKHCDSFFNIAIDKINTGGYVGLETCFRDLDELYSGFCPYSLNILVGKTNAGKSLFMINIVKNLIKKGKKILYIDLDGGWERNMFRLGHMSLKQPIYPLIKKPNDQNDIVIAKQRLLKFQKDYKEILKNLDYIEKKGIIYNQLENICNMKDYDLIMIDYLQILKTPKDKESFEKTTEIAEGLSELSTNLKTPLLVASQTGRKTSQSKDKEGISTAKGSGSIEELATTLLNFEREQDKDKNWTNYMKISIDKDKDNATGKSIRLKFNPSIQLLEDI